MATGTRDLGRRALHRVTDSVSGVNMRPTVFADEVTLSRYACCVCHVLPSTTIVLPCSHSVCRQCQVGCTDKDGRSLCPMDGEPFCESECQESKLSAREKQDLRACCWNESYGCDFVGPLAGVLEHYEQECAFHVSPCQKCGEIVMTDMLAAHYIGHLNCRLPSQTLSESPLQGDGASIASNNATASGSGADEELMRVFEMTTVGELQRTVDALERMTETIDAQLGANRGAA
ncbi:TNF receptor-associated factor 6-like [Rhipicephalus sanguineus]|uniref:TNF receptor-associated factor 6-like n=1 Tax=Rhipicephalus sanguineus TaxID=34632 RepID=UPI0020C40C89|nr:TNF receptor-associated factor 6-like [Rhipicephalus sanguineus]